MADPLEAAKFLDVEVDHVARSGVFVASGRRWRVEIARAREASGAKDTTDGRGGNPCLAGDFASRATQPAQIDHTIPDGLRGGLVKAKGPRRSVSERLQAASFEAAHPLSDGLEANSEGGGDRSWRLLLEDYAPRDLGSTMRGRTGILVDVHSAYLRRN
jgi:hypothetical protein